VDDFVNVPDPPFLDITAELTLSGWIYKTGDTPTNGYDDIVAKCDSGCNPDNNFWMGIADISGSEYLEFAFRTVSDQIIRTTNTIPSNRWQHVVITYNDAQNSIRMYIDGVSQSTTVVSGNPENTSLTPNSQNVRIGFTITGEEFSGLIDDVHIYNRALSAAEIKRLYDTTQSKFNASQTDSLTKGLVGYWTFDGGDIFGTSARDKSGNNNHGTITGATKVSGKVGQGMSFDGTNDDINAGSASTLDNLQSMTLAAWVYSNPQGAFMPLIEKSTGTGPTNGWALVIDSTDNTPWFLVDYDNTNLERQTSTPLKTRGWSHVALTWNGSATATNVRIYVDGVEGSYQTTINGDTNRQSDATASLTLGLGGGTYFRGQLDDVRIYNRALSAGEVLKLYNMGH